jgi:hypothetical protein
VAWVLKTRTPFGEIVQRVSVYPLKRVSLTGLAESDVSMVGKNAEPSGMMFSGSLFVKSIINEYAKREKAADEQVSALAFGIP